ncbi:hypothetical protein CYMTET_19122 [Cymbomonas tetramitiformis]|uniref:Rab-GAP TBC domain-containing protein n=1 Tax=Cymbomonas tetramitiformis TaxID=36881 RepID=A0AAE0G6U5_9CHLO|nr:hypothetical protein CYMTET_19122 [Cymbomonas tetramitiformis]
MSLTSSDRKTLVDMMVKSIPPISWSLTSKTVSHDDAKKIAEGIEKTAWESASSSSGERSELLRAYTSSASKLLLADMKTRTDEVADVDQGFAHSAAFWEAEKATLIMELENGELSSGSAGIRVRTKQVLSWLSKVSREEGGTESSELKRLTPAELKRIIEMDCFRTFMDDGNRAIMRGVLEKATIPTNGEYHQAMARVYAFIMLVVDENNALELLSTMYRSPKYRLSNYWRNQAVGIAEDAHLLEDLLRSKNTALSEKLAELGCTVGSWAPKILAALGVGIVPFSALFQFFENFVIEGANFLLKFSLAMFEVLEPELNDCENVASALCLLRFNASPLDLEGKDAVEWSTKICSSVLAAAARIELPPQEELEKKREAIRNSVLKESIARASGQCEEDEDDGIHDCGICTEGLADLYCNDCEAEWKF